MISSRSNSSRRRVPVIRSQMALPRIVNYTRSGRSVPARPGDAPVPSPVRPGLRVRRLPPELGEDRVHLHDENGQLFSLPARWTDAAAADPFVVVAAGRAPFTMAGLLALADLVDQLRAQRDGTEAVKKIMP